MYRSEFMLMNTKITTLNQKIIVKGELTEKFVLDGTRIEPMTLQTMGAVILHPFGLSS